MNRVLLILFGAIVVLASALAEAQRAKPITHAQPPIMGNIAPKLGPSRSAPSASNETRKKFSNCSLNADEKLLVQDLRLAISKLRQRELELVSREAALKALQAQIEQDLTELRTLQKVVTGQLDKRDKKRAEKVKKAKNQLKADRLQRIQQLARILKKMKPTEAATIVARIDDDIAVPALEALGERTAGKIVAQLPPDRAFELMNSLVAKPIEKEAP